MWKFFGWKVDLKWKRGETIVKSEGDDDCLKKGVSLIGRCLNSLEDESFN